MNIVTKSVLAIGGLGMLAGYMLSKEGNRDNAKRVMNNAKHNAQAAVDKAKQAYAEKREGGARSFGSSRHEEDLLDEGIVESFPASDPVSVSRVD